MLERIFNFTSSNSRNIEKLIDDDHLLINHIVLPKGEGLPEHYSNSNVYLVVIRGNMTLKLDEQDSHSYTCGQIINIPYHTKMKKNNFHEEVLEFFVIKAPNPRNYREI